MIFQIELERLVRHGRKTITRRPVKPDQPCRYRTGHSYAVQPGRGKPATCRITITGIDRQFAGAITLPDAVGEGFKTTDDFKAYWIALHDKPWLGKQRAFVEALNANALADDATIDIDKYLAARSIDRFDTSHADRAVWRIEFVLDTTLAPRLLAAQSDELYVTSPAMALAQEPEAVTEYEQEQITRRAGMVTEQWTALEASRRDGDRELLSREDQLARIQRAARLRSVDVTREVWALRNSLNIGNRENFERKMRKTEQKVFRMAA